MLNHCNDPCCRARAKGSTFVQNLTLRFRYREPASYSSIKPRSRIASQSSTRKSIASASLYDLQRVHKIRIRHASRSNVFAALSLNAHFTSQLRRCSLMHCASAHVHSSITVYILYTRTRPSLSPPPPPPRRSSRLPRCETRWFIACGFVCYRGPRAASCGRCREREEERARNLAMCIWLLLETSFYARQRESGSLLCRETQRIVISAPRACCCREENLRVHSPGASTCARAPALRSWFVILSKFFPFGFGFFFRFPF